MPKFIVKNGSEAGREIPMTGKRLVFGRADDCQVVLSDANASRMHAHAIDLDGLIAFVDLNSSNGTFVNELPISRVFLMDGDEIRIGDTLLAYSSEELGGRDLAGSTAASSVRLQPAESREAKVPAAGDSGNTLVFESIPESTQVEALKDTYLKLKAVYRVFHEVAQAGNLGEMFEAVGRGVTISGAGQRAVFLLAAEKTGEDWQQFHIQTVSTLDERQASAPVSRALLGRAREEQRVIQGNVTAGGEVRFEGETNAIGVPLMRGSKVVAAMYVDNPGSGAPFTKDNIDFLQVLGLQLALRLRQVEQVQQLQRENVQLRQQAVESDLAVIVQNDKMKQIMALTERVAESESTVLIHGESGTGKELIARSIHRFSPRSNGPLVAVNCAALPETLLESELFGHEKGAFTGAVEKRQGKFELADGGTLFLDEIGDISLAAQAKLLRALQEGEVQRVGGNRTIKVDVRLIAATNKNLADEVKKGNFRQDLFFRIKVIDIQIPPLRDRRDEIPALAEYFLKVLRQKLPTKVKGFSPDALEVLKRHSYPGNVRELRNIVERALVFATGESVLPEHLPAEVFDASQPLPVSVGSAVSSLDADGTPLSLEEMERRHIRFVLDHAKGNKLRAAQLLGISRTTLYEKLRAYDGNSGDSRE